MNYDRHLKAGIFFLGFGAVLAFSHATFAAWIDPETSAPGGNIEAPINVGSGSQSKSGSLTIGGTVNIGSGLSYLITKSGDSFALTNNAGAVKFVIGQDGNVGIGTAGPGAKLDVNGQIKISGGTPGLGKVLTSDAAGLATWQTTSALPAGVSGQTLRHNGTGWIANSTIYNDGTNVGIGIVPPTSPFHVKTVSGGWQDQFQNDNGGTPASYVYLSHGGGYGAHIRSYTTSDYVYALELYNSASQLAAFYASGRTILGLVGNVGIGTAGPGAKLEVAGQVKITGGTPGAGKVLTSDASGLATWQTPSAGATYAALSGIPTRSGWVGIHRGFVAEQLSWKNYGNGHTIFDASNGTSPDGGAVNNTNSQVAWTASYPTLMGWNGSNTYGIRVDSARVSDSADTTDGYHLNQAVTNGANPQWGTTYANNWFRSQNASGWYSETYGGGIWMQNSSYVEVYGGKGFLVPSGNVGIGTASPWAKLTVSGGKAAFTRDGVSECCGNDATIGLGESTSGTGRKASISFHNGGVHEGTFELAGSGERRFIMRDNQGALMGLEATGNIRGLAFYYTSDASLKKNIVPIDDSLGKIAELNGVYFKWKDSGNPSMGLIAQDVEKVFPEAVSANSETGLKSVDYGKLVAPLIEAVKTQQMQIDSLESEVEELKSQNSAAD